MRLNNTVIFAVALACAGLAALLAHAWLKGQSGPERVVVEKAAPEAKTRPILVAATDLDFGHTLTAEDIRTVKWPKDAVPKGAFDNADALVGNDSKRTLLTKIAANEPILAHKVTGNGQEATLAAKIGADKKAVTIRVNDILGVAGFIQPDDRVDIFLTRNERKPGDDPGETNAYTTVLLQGVRVLAVDQVTQRTDKPQPPKAVTVEVSTMNAQKLTLAASIGQLSLALRRAGVADQHSTRPVVITDLSKPAEPKPETASDDSWAVAIVRGGERTEYRVKEDDRAIWEQQLLRYAPEN